jgi:tetratricopeptide (TPR) repeat protein
MKPKLIIILFIIIANNVFGQADSLLSKANRLYEEKRFEEAAITYESIIDSGYEAYQVYYNLANAYFKSHKLGKAILNYERAHKLNTSDEDVIYNLEIARSMVVDKINEIPPFFLKIWINNIARIFTPTIWLYISITTFIIGLLLFLIYFLARKISFKKLGFWIGVIMIVLSLSSFIFGQKCKKIIDEKNFAIIIESSVTAKSSPDDSGTNLFSIHEGTKVEIISKVGQWVEIRIADGNKGWMPENLLEII